MSALGSGHRRALRIGLQTVVALVSTAALVTTGLAWTLQQRVMTDRVTSDAVDRKTEPEPVGHAFTALLIGLDARTDAAGNPLPPAVLDALHAGPDEGQLHTDTIILLHVPAGRGAAPVAISIPRDSFVPITGGRGTHKINSAYELGLTDARTPLEAQGITGAELDRRGREAGRVTLVRTVEALTGVSIDHIAEINLAGFVELTEALGGVPVCLKAPARDSYSGVDLPAGPQTITGATALAFVRQRHGLIGGDLDRIARQQAFLTGLAHRLRGGGALTDPATLARLIDLVTRHVVLDRGWDLERAITQLAGLALDELTFRTIPTGRPDLQTPVDGVAVQIDQTAVRDFVRSIVYGTPVSAATTSPSTPRPSPPPLATSPPTSTAVPISPATTADGLPCVS